MKYKIYVNINIVPNREGDDAPFVPAGAMINFSREYYVTGETFTDIAPRIDAVAEAVNAVADKPGDFCVRSEPMAPADAVCLYQARCGFGHCTKYNDVGQRRHQ